jgi:Xaa-Pro dipeptidase
MRERDDLTFPMHEHRRRLAGLRERMARRRLDAMLVTDPESLFYLTEHQTTGYSYFQALVVPLEGEPFSLSRLLERSSFEARTWVEEVYAYDDTADAIRTLCERLGARGLTRGVLGIERNSYFFPAHQQERLRAGLSDAELVDSHGLVEELRVTKSAVELDVMRRAARACEAGMKAGQEVAVPGATENDIAAAICSAMFRAGGEYPAVLPFVTTGPRTMIGHATWEGRQMQPGEHAFLEVGGCFRRYHTAMMRTVIHGDISPSFERAERTMQQALEVAHQVLRPGITAGAADREIRRVVEGNDVGARLVTRTGYSIGIAFAPSWDEGYMLSLKPDSPTVLEEGTTLHVIPWMWGVDGDKTCGLSDAVYLTADGCESFYTLPRTFVVT